MTVKFTDLFVKNLKPKDKEYIVREKGGFGVRVMPSGRKVFFYLYRVDGQRRFLNLGTYKDTNFPNGVTLAHAHSEFESAQANVKLLKAEHAGGVDPVQERRNKKEKREEIRQAPTVADLIYEYIDKHAKKFKRSWQEDERILRKELLNQEKKKGDENWSKRKEKSGFDWTDRKAADITKRDIVLLLENIMQRGAPIMSNLTFAVIRKMFNFAVERDIIEYSPATGAKMLAPKVARDRALSEAEIKTLWERLDIASMSDEIRRALKLILVTAQRPGEVVGMHTSEIDGNWWTIPTERAKNKIAHRVYLTSTARELIGDLKVFDEATKEMKDKGFIFRTPIKAKEQSIDEKALSRALRNNFSVAILDKSGNQLFNTNGTPATENRLEIEHFTPHDLRRTAATFMAQSGTMDEVIDAILNHAKVGVIKVYNQYRYDKEKQTALEKWERKLISFVSQTDLKRAPTKISNKIELEGFQRAHPENMPKTRKVTTTEKQKLDLANQVLRAKGIKASEKTEIYKLICGKDYPLKRGRPSDAHRNLQVTIDFLSLMGETKTSAKDIMQKLAIIYDLPGKNINNGSGRCISDVNFNKIVVHNLGKLESDLNEYITAVDCGTFEDEKGIYNNSKTCLQGLARYKADKK